MFFILLASFLISTYSINCGNAGKVYTVGRLNGPIERFSELIFISVLKAKFGAACNNHKQVENETGDHLQKFLNDFSRTASEMEGMVISLAISCWSADIKFRQKISLFVIYHNIIYIWHMLKDISLIIWYIKYHLTNAITKINYHTKLKKKSIWSKVC